MNESEEYGNCPECGSGFDRVFKIDTRMQEYFNKGTPLYCFNYLCKSVAVCNRENEEAPITDYKFRRQSSACKIIKNLKNQWDMVDMLDMVTSKKDECMRCIGFPDVPHTCEGWSDLQDAIRDKLSGGDRATKDTEIRELKYRVDKLEGKEYLRERLNEEKERVDYLEEHEDAMGELLVKKEVIIIKLMNRLEISDLDDHDGIYCRDETIRLQDIHINELRERVDYLEQFIPYATHEFTCSQRVNPGYGYPCGCGFAELLKVDSN